MKHCIEYRSNLESIGTKTKLIFTVDVCLIEELHTISVFLITFNSYDIGMMGFLLDKLFINRYCNLIHFFFRNLNNSRSCIEIIYRITILAIWHQNLSYTVENQMAQQQIEASKVSVNGCIELALQDNKGQVRRLSDLKGEVVLLDFHLFARGGQGSRNKT